jgi:putative membrane-bound dehydrogenase-like protein
MNPLSNAHPKFRGPIRIYQVLSWAWGTAALCVVAASLNAAGPLTPQQSLDALRTKPGFQVDLIAAEPLVASPVAIDFGPDGKLWVVEMFDYPQGPGENQPPGGRIRLLESTRGDGQFDKATVFLDAIPLPTGVTVWRKGVLVCAAPDILYAEDTTGDGKADVVKKLFSGFATPNPQARVNSLEYGLDGWVYGASGLIGGTITSFAGGEPLALRGRDFRIRPDTGEIEAVSGRTQQGRARNDWGDWFGCDNETLCWHYPLAEQYLRRNPLVVPPPGAVSVSAGPDANRLYPASADVQRFKLTGPSGRPTAVCGLAVYRDDLLGSAYQENVFVCEAVNLLVHRMPLAPNGATFTSHRAADDAHSEFLASTDDWFRPVQARTGPDGALWIVDMHRFLIEHPRFLPPQEVAAMDVRAGENTGRIFRVRPEQRSLRRWPRLDQLDTQGLIDTLESANGWQRDMASRMLLWRADPAAVPGLESLATQSSRPRARLHALCVLDGLAHLRVDIVLAALRDQEAGVRRHAIRLSEPFLDRHSGVGTTLLALANDPDPQVRLQLAYTLGQWHDTRAAAGLASLALRAEDPYQSAAILSSLRADSAADVVVAVLGDRSRADAQPAFVRQMLAVAVALADVKTLPRILAPVTADAEGPVSPAQWAALLGTIEALRRREPASDDRIDPATSLVIDRRLVAAARLAVDDRTMESERLATIALLGRTPKLVDEDLAALEQLLTPRQSAAIQQAAVAALGRISDERAAQLVLDGWKGHSPALKGSLLDFLLGRPDGLRFLFAAIAGGRVPVQDIDASRRQRLLNHKEPEIRESAARLFAGATNADRGKVIDQYRTALELHGDRARGKAVFAKTCSVCHRLEETGYRVGPDLESLANKSPQSLLQEILDPNRNLDGRWVVYNAITHAGRTVSGLLANENAGSITLAGQEGKQEVLLRSDIDEFQGTGQSLMPEGLEKDLKPQDLADLLAYLTNLGPPPKQFAGNSPETIRPADGVLTLPAAKAAIFGEEILFEARPNGNIGQWRDARDHIVWTVELPGAADFDVWLDWACDDYHSGNTFSLYGGEPAIRQTVTSSGSWYRYRQAKIGSTHLAAGLHRLTVQPEGEIKRALMDLRALYLVPPGTRPPLALAAAGAPVDLKAIARQILDDGRSEADRKEIVGRHLDHAAGLVGAMTADLLAGTPEEYRRIPWIWRVSIGAARQNRTDVLRDLLDVSLPARDQPLRDWQAVVVGGGIINGISQLNLWPRERLAELVKGKPALGERWRRLLVQAAEMADNKKTPTGTRYDALRIIPLDDWNLRGSQLKKYLAKGTHDELQMGAISGLSDVDRPEAAQWLLENLGHFSMENRQIAVSALLRTDERAGALIEALEKMRVAPTALSDAQRKALRELKNEKLRARALRLLPP